MQCPTCAKGDTRVVDSREDEQAIRRRRECTACQFRFTTFERIEIANLMVIKRDGRRQPFAKQKLIAGILTAGEKRPGVIEQAETIADRIERELYDRCQEEISSSEIGQAVLSQLKNIDKIAYLRFASVYHSFTDLDTFKQELSRILQENK